MFWPERHPTTDPEIAIQEKKESYFIHRADIEVPNLLVEVSS